MTHNGVLGRPVGGMFRLHKVITGSIDLRQTVPPAGVETAFS
jgi:hypothetical protein